jgi:ubiquitin C-terminal hydrolase
MWVDNLGVEETVLVTYQLFALVLHTGDLSSGHYTALGRVSQQQRNNGCSSIILLL